MDFQKNLENFIKSLQVSDVGFAKLDEPINGMEYAISFVIRLSEAVIDEIDNAPTHTYFHHYRTVNAYIDRTILQTGMYLQNAGYKYIPVGASQSINKDGWNYKGLVSSRMVACKAGLGTIGKNSMFIHSKFGPAVRLGTLLTNCPFENVGKEIEENLCGECTLCVDACPAKALTGKIYTKGTEREEIIDPQKCSDYMKKEFKHIGRGAVCGICMKVCKRRCNK